MTRKIMVISPGTLEHVQRFVPDNNQLTCIDVALAFDDISDLGAVFLELHNLNTNEIITTAGFERIPGMTYNAGFFRAWFNPVTITKNGLFGFRIRHSGADGWRFHSTYLLGEQDVRAERLAPAAGQYGLIPLVIDGKTQNSVATFRAGYKSDPISMFDNYTTMLAQYKPMALKKVPLGVFGIMLLVLVCAGLALVLTVPEKESSEPSKDSWIMSPFGKVLVAVVPAGIICLLTLQLSQ
ncbi:MAG: hypothetical protein NUW37_06730 [Planctomycetes bacterium]|nr:hypothetical protein [Planctomycetota bacterium]